MKPFIHICRVSVSRTSQAGIAAIAAFDVASRFQGRTRNKPAYVALCFCAAAMGFIFVCGNNPSDAPRAGKVTGIVFSANKWHLVSFPVRSTSTANFLPPHALIAYWDETKAPDSAYSYYCRNECIDSIGPGRAYWIKCSTEVAFSLDTLEEFTEESLCVSIRKGLRLEHDRQPIPVSNRYSR
jgi:hypothetical protein